MRYALEIAYHGGPWHGWQRQPNAPTVQQTLEEALATLLRAPEPVSLTASGRTDAGVHARRQFAHFDWEGDLPPDLLARLRGVVPRSIGVLKIHRAAPEFHARFSALSRAYTYEIQRQPSPFLQGLAYYYPHPLDLKAMSRATHLLLGWQDFGSFCRTGGAENHTWCEVLRARWRVGPDRLRFEVAANRFLRGMVRALVGTLLDVGGGKLKPEEMTAVLEARDRGAAGRSAPPDGLYLDQVVYPPGLLEG